ncbi:hypothetical protein BKA69DRAFT_647293 [Paraphysoderma sedebokerense]|nr:hypothetical protein BKA69DRAFT_647293 [Paraphysoderma sedebokerense]
MGKKKSSKKADNRGYATSSQPKAKKTGESIKESAASGSSGSPPVVSTTTEPKLTVKEEQKINSKISKALKDLAGDPDVFKLDDDIANWLKSSDADVPVLRLESRMEHELVSVLRDIGAVKDIDAESLTRPLNLSDQRLLRKLNYTYLALQRLEFQNQDIEKAMKNSESWDLERALEWLCLHLPLERLPKRFADKMYYESENTVTVMKSKSRRSEEGPSTPSNFNAPPIKAPQTRKSDIDESWKKDILSRFEYENESESEEELDDRLSLSKTSQNPNLLYADYKVGMVSLQSSAKGEADQKKKIEIDSKVRDIRRKLEAIRQHKSFSMVEAESEFRKRMKAEHAQQKTTPNSSTPTIFAPDSLDDEQDSLPSSLFSETPAPIVHSPFKPKKLIVRQLYFSGWTGKVPKQLLNDTLKREDSKCKITYSDVRTPGGVFRSKCVVKSGRGEITEYSMIDKGDATETKQEAEHYAATLALHGIAKGRPLYRMLPPTYKDLWLEWDSQKESDMMDDKRVVDEQRIHFLLSLMDIVKRFKSAGQPSADLPKSHQQLAGPKRTLITSSVNLIGEFEKRQAKDSYRKLLKQRQALPVNQYKSEIIRLINQNRVVLISGQTGR